MNTDERQPNRALFWGGLILAGLGAWPFIASTPMDSGTSLLAIGAIVVGCVMATTGRDGGS